jgi:octaprenyl-diphosphate synthase
MLQKVKDKIFEFVNDLQDQKSLELYSKIQHGKMLRSKLILKIANSDNDDVITSCAIVEMIHLASLLHDDVIDNADTRRGRASINAIYDNHSAIMFGDILYSKAFSELSLISSDIAHIISLAVTKLSIGEMLDVELSKSFNTSFEAYYDMIYKKTSALIEASAEVGAILSSKNTNAYKIYGKNLGVAFQIVDDILDIVQNESVLGKPAMSDLKEGKVTLPYLFYYHDGSDKDKEYIISKFKKELDAKESKELKDRLIESGAILKTKAKVNEIAHIAINAIKDEASDELIGIINSMIDREF